MGDPGTITSAVNAIGVQPEVPAFPRIYAELRRLAASQLAKERRGKTLDPTVLVHAAYEKLFGKGNPGWQSRRHFYGAASNAMRQLLIDEARKRRVRREVPLAPHPATALVFGYSAWGPAELLSLDQALKELERRDPPLGEIVRLRVFAAQSMAQVAELTGLSSRTCERHWRAAKSWLFQRMHGTGTRDERRSERRAR